jgi:hypothetical protein
MSLVSASSGTRPEADSEGARIAASADDLVAFWDWFKGSIALDPLGRPLVVYRGEHGDPETAPDFSTRLGSLSFGDFETARCYAEYPNRREDEPVCPRILLTYLVLRRPVLNRPDDPFIDLTVVETALGRRHAERIAEKFEWSVMRTSPWMEGEIDADSIKEFLESDPNGLSRLYFEAYRLFDDPEEVAHLQAAGFDGAIYGGIGFNALETEFRVFDKAAVWKVSTNRLGGLGMPGVRDSSEAAGGFIAAQR